jgi:hypothetical protein
MLFATTFLYALAKVAGPKWPEIQAEIVRSPLRPPVSCDGLETIREMGALGEPVTLWIDGCTLIGKARSRASGEFLRRADCDVWVTVDDDVYAHGDVLRTLVAAARETRGVVAVPYIHRDGHALAFAVGKLDEARVQVTAAAALYRAEDGVGLGLTAIHRDAIIRVAREVPQATAETPPFPALFLEDVDEGRWIGEDYAFARLCHACGVPVDLLLDAACCHAGRWSRLTSDLRLYVGDDEAAFGLMQKR